MEETSKKVRHTQKVTVATSKPDWQGRILYYEIRTANGSYIGSAIPNENPLPGDDEITMEDAKKNAYLWASAPSLLEALESVQRLRPLIEYPGENVPMEHLNEAMAISLMFDKVDEAIKLAKGNGES